MSLASADRKVNRVHEVVKVIIVANVELLVNVEHKVRRDLKEVVITRTSRGRRSGVDDDRRDGQLWEPGQLGGGAPGERVHHPRSRHNLGNSKKSQPRLTLVISVNKRKIMVVK